MGMVTLLSVTLMIGHSTAQVHCTSRPNFEQIPGLTAVMLTLNKLLALAHDEADHLQQS